MHLVAGFGRIVDLPPARFLTAVDDAESLLAAEEGIVAHLNADNRDTMNLYAVHLAGAPTADWSCAACDPDGLDLAAEGRYLRLTFPRHVTSPEVLRMLLKELAAQARAKAG